MSYKHIRLDIQGGIINAKMLRGFITVDGHTLNSVGEIQHFLLGQLDMGRRFLPCGECDNFDYQTGECLGHVNDAMMEQTREEAEAALRKE